MIAGTMSANSKTIEDLKRRLMESWSVYDENENQDPTATCLDMRSESLTSPTNSPTWQYIPSPNLSAKKGSRGRFSMDGKDSSARSSGFKVSPKPTGKPSLLSRSASEGGRTRGQARTYLTFLQQPDSYHHNALLMNTVDSAWHILGPSYMISNSTQLDS